MKGKHVVEQTRFDARVRQWAEAGAEAETRTRRRFLGVLAGVSASAAAMLPALDEAQDAEASGSGRAASTTSVATR